MKSFSPFTTCEKRFFYLIVFDPANIDTISFYICFHASSAIETPLLLDSFESLKLGLISEEFFDCKCRVCININLNSRELKLWAQMDMLNILLCSHRGCQIYESKHISPLN